MLPADVRFALVLSGGNALGAYHAGLYEALHEAELEPQWICGTSIGAVTGALIAGNPREDRLRRLAEFWRPEPDGDKPLMPWDWVPDSWRRSGAVLETLLAGRPGAFGPLGSTAGWWHADARAGGPALYATAALSETLHQLIDMDLLNAGEMRLTMAAVDVETGEEVIIDSAQRRIDPDHIRASASLLTAFPALEVDGRLLGDGGLSMNLPLDPVLAEAGAEPVLCIAADLLPLAGARPQTLGEAIGRMQDLKFATQSARSLRRWQASLPQGDPDSSVALAMAVYSDQEAEVAGKAMDFSPRSVRHRWACGLRDGRALVQRIRSGDIRIGERGLTIYPP
jgi:NTE family protein